MEQGRQYHSVGAGTAADYMVRELLRWVEPAGWQARLDGWRWIAEDEQTGRGVSVTAVTRDLVWTVTGWLPAAAPVPTAPCTMLRVDLSPWAFNADDADDITAALQALRMLPRPGHHPACLMTDRHTVCTVLQTRGV